LTNEGSITWADLAYTVAESFDLDKSLIRAVNCTEMNYTARRPTYSVLGSQRGHLLPTLENALNHYVREEKREKRQVA
jgi:dTDP-4-dehydrorhamnose reductase